MNQKFLAKFSDIVYNTIPTQTYTIHTYAYSVHEAMWIVMYIVGAFLPSLTLSFFLYFSVYHKQLLLLFSLANYYVIINQYDE